MADQKPSLAPEDSAEAAASYHQDGQPDEPAAAQHMPLPGAFRMGGRDWNNNNNNLHDNAWASEVSEESSGSSSSSSQQGVQDYSASLAEIQAELVDEEAERSRYQQEAQERIWGQTPKAEVVDVARQQRKRRICMGVALLLLIAAGLVIGLVVANGPSSSTTSALVSPTANPTLSFPPSSAPSQLPSAAPTIFHDTCQHAISVPSLPFFFDGTTDPANELGDNNPALACSTISSFDRGVWFQVKAAATGEGCITAAGVGTNFDVRVAVYVGTDCNELLCLTNPDIALTNEVTWALQKDEVYWILVAGEDSAAGGFSVTLSDSGVVCNAICEEPVYIHKTPFEFSGNNMLAPFMEPDSPALDCLLDLINIGTAGTWFEFTGRNSCINLSTVGSDLDTVIAVYEGDCDNLVCLTGADDTNADLTSEILFFAKLGTHYLVLVGNSIFQGRGTYNLNVTEYASDQCSNHGLICEFDENNEDLFVCLSQRKLSLDFNATLFAQCTSPIFVEPTQDMCNCFLVVGDELEDFDSVQLDAICRSCAFVPQGETADGEWEISYDCSNVISGPCVTYTDDGQCLASEEVSPIFPEGDYVSCNQAITIDELPYMDSANSLFTHKLLLFDTDAFACSIIAPLRLALFHSITGRGTCIRATTEGSSFDTVLSVYEGECGSVACLRQNDDVGESLSSQVEWFGQTGISYQILLSGLDLSQQGAYTFLVEEFDCELDEACAAALLVDELPFAYQGSTANSTGINLGSQALSCSLVQPFSKGVWYVGEVFSSVACVTISTAGSRFNTVIAVYSGSCTNLECVTENDDSSTLVRSSEVSWTALRGIQYYVYVGGVDSTESGEFLVSGTWDEGVPCPG